MGGFAELAVVGVVDKPVVEVVGKLAELVEPVVDKLVVEVVGRLAAVVVGNWVEQVEQVAVADKLGESDQSLVDHKQVGLVVEPPLVEQRAELLAGLRASV